MNPKVFISHASEDKNRFVIDFATRLRAKGVDAWVDRWEMLPGDSLVDKVFEEGIKNAQAVIVVLSNYSVTKKWVREELNAAFIKRINDASKLIPVVIDECEVPETLKSTVWERIRNLTSYDAEFERILMAIYGKYEKPEVGKAPAFTRITIEALPNLTETDTLIFKTACELAIEQEVPIIDFSFLKEKLTPSGLSHELIFESVDILDGRGYLNASKVLGGDISHFQIPWSGFLEYFRYYLPNYNELVDQVAFMIVNEGQTTTESFSSKVKQPRVIINHILETLERNGFIQTSKYLDGTCEVFQVSPELKRKLRAG